GRREARRLRRPYPRPRVSGPFDPARRRFLVDVTLAAGALGASGHVQAHPRAAAIRFGCAAITWGGDDAHAIEDIGALGFRGIQLRANAADTYGARVDALRALLGTHHVGLVAMSSGNIGGPSVSEADDIAFHTAHARFVREAGGTYLQVI